MYSCYSSQAHFFEVSDPEATINVQREELTIWSVTIIFALSLATLTGSIVFSRWIKRRLTTNAQVSTRVLVWINVSLNAMLSLPIIVAALVFREQGVNVGSAWLVCFLLLVLLHKVAGSIYKVSYRTLQNRLISKETPARATILSIGSTVQNLLIIGVMLLGMGKDPSNLFHWLWPGLFVCFMTLLMTFFVTGQPSSKDKW